MIPRTDVLEPVDLGELEGAPWRADPVCLVHFTAIENCIDEHGLDLEPVTIPRERYP